MAKNPLAIAEAGAQLAQEDPTCHGAKLNLVPQVLKPASPRAPQEATQVKEKPRTKRQQPLLTNTKYRKDNTATETRTAKIH